VRRESEKESEEHDEDEYESDDEDRAMRRTLYLQQVWARSHHVISTCMAELQIANAWTLVSANAGVKQLDPR
jgi:hypothetical protein